MWSFAEMFGRRKSDRPDDAPPIQLEVLSRAIGLVWAHYATHLSVHPKLVARYDRFFPGAFVNDAWLPHKYHVVHMRGGIGYVEFIHQELHIRLNYQVIDDQTVKIIGEQRILGDDMLLIPYRETGFPEGMMDWYTITALPGAHIPLARGSGSS